MAAAAGKRWTTVADIRHRVRRRWGSGELLAALAREEPFPAVELPIRGPKASQIGADLAAVQQWIAELEAGSRGGDRYQIEYGTVGGREFGRNRIPARARVESYRQAWALLGVAAEVQAFTGVLAEAGEDGVARDWAVRHPLPAIALAQEWPTVLAAHRWLDRARGSGRYLREIDAPGVDTKFVERHRPVLAQLLGVSRSGPGFVAGLGMRDKPRLLRMRVGEGFAGLPYGLSEVALRPEEAIGLRVSVASAVVVENEISYLSVPVPSDGVVIWGQGFDVDRVGRLPWLQDADVHYWGDLDTHGFAILSQLRAWLPQTQSVLMDRETLLQHRDRWGTEPSPTSAALPNLTQTEAALYADLVSDRYGDAVRLEQERIGWAWAAARLPSSAG